MVGSLLAPKREDLSKDLSPFMRSGLDHKMDMWTYVDYPCCFEVNRMGGFYIKGGKVTRFTFKNRHYTTEAPTLNVPPSS